VITPHTFFLYILPPLVYSIILIIFFNTT